MGFTNNLIKDSAQNNPFNVFMILSTQTYHPIKFIIFYVQIGNGVKLRYAFIIFQFKFNSFVYNKR